MRLLRLLRRASAATLILGAGPAIAKGPPALPEAFEIPSGTRPFSTPIRLRYGGFADIAFFFRSDIAAGGRRQIAEGWVMRGALRRDGDRLQWSYSLSNIGRDERLRERGRLRVTTDPWGAVLGAEVLEDQWATMPNRPRIGADSLFDAADLAFPLCCCPREPVVMGQPVALSPSVMTMPGPIRGGEDAPAEVTLVDAQSRSVAAGVLEEAGGPFLVVRHEGRWVMDTPDGRMIGQRRGYSLISIATCLPHRSAWKTTMEIEGKPTPPFALVRSNGTP